MAIRHQRLNTSGSKSVTGAVKQRDAQFGAVVVGAVDQPVWGVGMLVDGPRPSLRQRMIAVADRACRADCGQAGSMHRDEAQWPRRISAAWRSGE